MLLCRVTLLNKNYYYPTFIFCFAVPEAHGNGILSSICVHAPSKNNIDITLTYKYKIKKTY